MDGGVLDIPPPQGIFMACGSTKSAIIITILTVPEEARVDLFLVDVVQNETCKGFIPVRHWGLAMMEKGVSDSS